MNAVIFFVLCAGVGVLTAWLMGKAARSIEEAAGLRRRTNHDTIRGGQTVVAVAAYDPFVPVVCLVRQSADRATVRIGPAPR